MTVALPPPPERPTMYFIGVTTGASFINRLFPRWAPVLAPAPAPEPGPGRAAPAELRGIDIALGAPAQDYRAVAGFLRRNRLARGALVTTHKVAMVRHAGDLIARLDSRARILGEVSCLVCGPAGLAGHALDPVAGGLALAALAPDGYWRDHPAAEALILGAGGAGMALALHLLERPAGDRPARIALTDVSDAALAHARAALGRAAPGRVPDLHRTGGADGGDRLLAALPPASLVVNATGMGKDRPGSPLDPGAALPERGLVWELNYRGARPFLRAAEAQERARRLVVRDGWQYFLHGWSQAMARVFGTAIDSRRFGRLEMMAHEELGR